MTVRLHSAVLILLLALSGCSSTPVEDRYYSLVLTTDEAAPARVAGPGAPLLVVGPISLPDYLHKRGIALQSGASQIQTANHHFWAEPLDEAIAKVLVRDIERLSGNILVERDAGRWTGNADCRVRVEFDRFHATGDSRVVSSGRYWLVSLGDSASNDLPDARYEFSVSRPLSADGYAHAVQVLRESLNVVAEKINGHIDKQSTCTN